MKSHRRSFISKLTVAVAVGAAVAGLSAPAGAQQFAYNLADAYAPTEYINVNMQQWADDIRKATNGALAIKMHHSGSLYKNPDIKRAVQTGQVEFGTQLMQNLGPEKRLFEIDGLPFLAVGEENGIKLWEASKPYLTSYFQKQGLRILYTSPWPAQGFYFKKEVNTLADAKGLRQRAYNEMTSRLAALMGTIPTTVQITELAQAMTTGTIQCFNTSPTTAVVFKSWEYASHVIDANAWQPKQMVFVNEAAYAKLPAAVQKAVADASAAAEKRVWDISKQQAEDARKVLAKNGMKITKPSAAFQAELDKIGETLRNEWLQKADDDAKVVMTAYLKSIGR